MRKYASILAAISCCWFFARMKNVNRGGPAVLGRMREPREVSIDEVIGRLDDPTLVVLDTRADRAAFMKRTSSSIAKVYYGEPDDFFDYVPMSCFFLRPAGTSGKWQAVFDAYGHGLYVQGQGSKVTVMLGKFRGEDVWYHPDAKPASTAAADLDLGGFARAARQTAGQAEFEGQRRAGEWQGAPAATPSAEQNAPMSDADVARRISLDTGGDCSVKDASTTIQY